MSASADKLVMMANQIARFFTPQRGADPVAAIADHLEKFCDPRRTASIGADGRAVWAGLDGPVREAVVRLKEA